MPLEKQIVEWASTRPEWQKSVLKRVAAGKILSQSDFQQIADDLCDGKPFGHVTFGIADLPQVKAGAPAVSLISIADPEHVNALTSEKPLTVGETGLTIIYGDNASGKSGYARLLKRIARARHQEDVLTDVFRDNGLAQPRATVVVKIGDAPLSLSWPDSSVPELQQMRFYDDRCSQAYVSSESHFPYRPSALFVLDKLIEACIAVRTSIDEKLEINAGTAKQLPVVDQEISDTDVAQFLSNLSGESSLQVLDESLNKLEGAKEGVEDLKAQEVRLSATSATREKQTLARRVEKLETVKTHLQTLDSSIGDSSVEDLKKQRDKLAALRQAADLLKTNLESEALSGVGTSVWKELWESARLYSESSAYPDQPFPVVQPNSHCVLCQQVLDDNASQRLSRFEQFVTDDTQKKLTTAEEAWKQRVTDISQLLIVPEAIDTNLKDLQDDHSELVEQVRTLLAQYTDRLSDLARWIQPGDEINGVAPTIDNVVSLLDSAATGTRTLIEGLSDPEKTRQMLSSARKHRKEIELLQEVKKERTIITQEITRLKQRDALESIKTAAATGPITNKVLELSEENITEVVRDTFTRETDRLNLERVTIAKTRGERGALLHQPKLIAPKQEVTLPRVFSEGERTALGLAAFFTEAQLDESKSALIFDDPVSSLDHIRRGKVAERLVQFAEVHQVIIFTHDVSFVADLKREARRLGTPVSERSIVRSRSGEKKPGSCTEKLPWKTKDVAERITELRQDLVRIKRDSSVWDDTNYEKEVSDWAGKLSETWERVFSQEIVGQILAEGGVEVRPNMVKILTRFSEGDNNQFQASYNKVSQWARRHDKSQLVNYVAPEVTSLEAELDLIDQWFKRVKSYKN